MSIELMTMDTTPVDAATAAAIEAAEARAWEDVYAAAPSDWAADVGLGTDWVGETLVLHWAATGRRYFSRAIGLGVTARASEADIDGILALWERLGIGMFLLQSMPHCAPAAYTSWLEERGMEPFDQQDRIVCRVQGGAVAAPPNQRGLLVERVEPAAAEEWSQFLQSVYRIDTGPWLPLLIDRPGWHQYVAREQGRIVAARGMYVGADGIAWLGMEGPVPGVVTGDYAPDAAICAAIVADGAKLGARMLIADIELPSEAMDTPAYADFAALGFSRPYTRTHWARV
jgi:hypothetical protein